MINQPIEVINKLGLHTRAAAKLVALASHYESKIELAYSDVHIVNCKSIMGVITLGATFGRKLQLVVSGSDEQEAYTAIVELFKNRFGEEE